VKKEHHNHHEPMPMKGKKEDGSGSSIRLPSCSRCGATLDLELIKSFGSRRIIVSDDDDNDDDEEGKSYYCNNPLCAPGEEEHI
jgi:hypothetical protein